MSSSARPLVKTLPIPPAVYELAQLLASNGFRAWLVGGSLRDAILGRPINDWDIATDALPKQIMTLFRRTIPTGIAHGTVTVLWNDQTFEVTTLRGEEGYSDGRRPDQVRFINSIEEDLRRRDFTINAMAYDLRDRELIDPFRGMDDLHEGVLRAVEDPYRRMQEDGLRILRAARFVATLEFTLEAATQKALGSALDTLQKVSRERIRDEWLRTMQATKPSLGWQVMLECGALDVLCTELAAMSGCTQNRHHAYDVWEHTLRCIDLTPEKEHLRLTALFHDIGKPMTRHLDEKRKDVTFFRHEIIGSERTEKIMREYRFPKALTHQVAHLVRHHLIVYEASWSDAAVRRFIRRVGVEHLSDLIEFARADVSAKGVDCRDSLASLDALEKRIQALSIQPYALSTRELALDGNDIIVYLGLAPGPRVGELLEALLEKVIDDPSLNEKTKLLALLKEIAGS